MPASSRFCLTLLALIAFLSACATQPPPQYAALDLPQDYLLKDEAEPSQPFPESSWWQHFGSPALERLIARAERSNPDLSAAAARIARADAELRRSGASLWPQASAEGSAARSSRPWAEDYMDRGGTSYNLGLRASYELDLW